MSSKKILQSGFSPHFWNQNPNILSLEDERTRGFFPSICWSMAGNGVTTTRRKRSFSRPFSFSVCVSVMLHIGWTSIFWIKIDFFFFFFEITHQNDDVLVSLILSCWIFHFKRSLQGFTLEDPNTYFVKSISSVYFTWINSNGCIHNFFESKCWVVYFLLEFELPLVCNSSISKSGKNSKTIIRKWYK